MSPLPPSASSATTLLSTIFPQSTSTTFLSPFSVSESDLAKPNVTAAREGVPIEAGIDGVTGGIEVGTSNNPVISGSETGVKEGVKSEIEGRPGKEYMPHYPDSVLIDPPSTPKIDTATVGCIIVGIVFAFLLVLVGVHRYLSKKEKVAEAAEAAASQATGGNGNDEEKSEKVESGNDGKAGGGDNGLGDAEKNMKQEEELVPPPTYTPGFMGRAAVNYHDVDLETGVVHPGNGNGKVNNDGEAPALVDYKVRLARLGSLGMW